MEDEEETIINACLFPYTRKQKNHLTESLLRTSRVSEMEDKFDEKSHKMYSKSKRQPYRGHYVGVDGNGAGNIYICVSRNETKNLSL